MIIDTHTHFGDPSRPNPLLHRTEMPEAYKAVALPEGVTGTVVVEAQIGIQEVQWMLDLAVGDSFIVGYVADADGRHDGQHGMDPYSQEFGRQLDRFAANPLFSGIRVHGLKHDSSEMFSRFLESMEQLVARDLELDIDIEYYKLDALFEVTRRLPELRVVINHSGHGRRIDGKTVDPQWAERMRMAAEYPGIHCKVSGLVGKTDAGSAPSDVEVYRPRLDALWDAFGEDRLIYGSNWPVTDRGGEYQEQLSIINEFFAPKGHKVLEKLYWKNASKFYGVKLGKH